MKFLIKVTENSPVFHGDATEWGTGQTPFINHTETMNPRKYGSKIKFTTGLSETDIDTNRQLTSEEKEIFKEKLKTDLPTIEKYFPELRSKDNSTDENFWNNDRTTFRITNNTFSSVFDTEQDPENALLYYAIIGGAFGGISPSKEIAERVGNKFYMTGEDEFTEDKYEEEYGAKRKAIGALDRLLEGTGIDSLLYMTYLTEDINKGFTRNTSKAVLEQALMEYIEGKLTKSGKKNAAKKFYDNYQLWKTDKETLIGKAIIAIAIHYQLIFFKDGKYITSFNNTVLESRQEESYKKLMKPENQAEFDEIRKAVEEKLNK